MQSALLALLLGFYRAEPTASDRYYGILKFASKYKGYPDWYIKDIKMNKGEKQSETEKAQQQPAEAKPMISLPCGVCSTATKTLRE